VFNFSSLSIKMSTGNRECLALTSKMNGEICYLFFRDSLRVRAGMQSHFISYTTATYFSLHWKLNFPYFLWKRLRKMSQGVQENSTNPHHSLYHYGLIKLLIEDELKFRNDSWDSSWFETRLIP